MGYQITWKTKNLPEEVKKGYDSQYYPYKTSEAWEDKYHEYKYDLIVKLLNMNKETQNGLQTINIHLRIYRKFLEEYWKWNMNNFLKEEEIWFCGWEYSRDDEDADYSNIPYETILEYCLCTKPIDVIEDEEYFYKKRDKICSSLSEYEEAVNSAMNHQFVDKNREYRIKYENE